jgi:hypothetical protein
MIEIEKFCLFSLWLGGFGTGYLTKHWVDVYFLVG